MTNLKLSWRARFVLGACLASLLSLVAAGNTADAQGGQGKYVAEASQRLVGLINKANGDGFSLADDRFSIGGGWLKQGAGNWVSLYTIQLTAGKQYRFLAAGDNDATDVDVEIQDLNGKTLKADTGTAPEAIVDFTPKTSGRYLVRVRLFASRNGVPCVCLAIAMHRK